MSWVKWCIFRISALVCGVSICFERPDSKTKFNSSSSSHYSLVGLLTYTHTLLVHSSLKIIKAEPLVRSTARGCTAHRLWMNCWKREAIKWYTSACIRWSPHQIQIHYKEHERLWLHSLWICVSTSKKSFSFGKFQRFRLAQMSDWPPDDHFMRPHTLYARLSEPCWFNKLVS